MARAKTRTRSFWFHYNKPASRRRGKPTATVHLGGRCVLVDHVIPHVPVRSRARKSQPHWVLAGRYPEVVIEGGTATFR